VKRVLQDLRRRAPSCWILREVIFQIQRANYQPASAVIQLHQWGVGQIEFAFQQWTPTAAMELLYGCTADPAAVAPMPAGVRLFSFISSEIISHVFRERLDECAATGPVAQAF